MTAGDDIKNPARLSVYPSAFFEPVFCNTDIVCFLSIKGLTLRQAF